MNKNILFVFDGTEAGKWSAQWMCLWPARAMEKAKWVVDTMSYADVLNPTPRQTATIRAADIVIFERHTDDPWMPFIEEIAATKRFFLTLDDAYWLAHESTPTYRFWSKGNRLANLERAAELAEGVIVPNRKLAEHFSNGIYRPNRPFLDDPDWSVRPLFSDNAILWGGTLGHISSLPDHPFLWAVNKLVDDGDAKFIAVCGSPDLKNVIEESVPGAQAIHSVPHSEWMRLVSGATVVANPLGPGYDEHRSWIKALEAALVGVRWVGSDVGVYDDARGGIIVEDTKGAWYDALHGMLNTEFEDREEIISWAWRQGAYENLEEWEAIFE